VTFDGATDVSAAQLVAGISGQTYMPATKTPPWNGTADGDLEGFTIGPLLPDGSWSLIGVVDNGGVDDPISGNTVVAFTLSPTVPDDYNFDGRVDAADFVVLRKSLGNNLSSNLRPVADALRRTAAGSGQQTPTREPNAVSIKTTSFRFKFDFCVGQGSDVIA
jgi:hypothetical protein